MAKSILTQNANVTSQKSNFFIFHVKVDIQNFRTEKQIQSTQTDVMSASHNDINNIGRQAHCLCLSVPGVVWQTRWQLNCMNFPTSYSSYFKTASSRCLKICPALAIVWFELFYEEVQLPLPTL